MSRYDNSTNQKGLEFDIFGYLKELSRRLWLVVAIGILCGILGGVVGKITSTEVYTSSASFIVNTLSENEKVENSAISAQINMANTFEYILSGRTMKEAVQEACPGNLSYAYIDSSISIKVVTSTNVVEMHVETDDPTTSYNIAKTVIDVYGDIVTEIYPNAKLTVSDRPVLAQSPDADKLPLVVAVAGAFVGMAVYCIIILVMFIIKDTVKNADELSETMNIPVLGAVQQVTNKSKTIKGLLIADRKAGFSFIETYKAIRTKIENNSARTGNKVYLVSSACENEGKTTVSVNIALSLAENGKSVLLIDADFRNPSVYKILALPESDTGFADVIRGKATLENAIKFVKNFNVYVLADQKATANPSELLSTKVTEDIIDSVRSEFDYVIIDTAPVSVVTDTAVIAGFADAAVLVVREDFAPFYRIRMSVYDIDSNGAEIIGFIFNADTSMTNKNGKYNRYNRYGRYGRYGNYSYGYGYGQDKQTGNHKK